MRPFSTTLWFSPSHSRRWRIGKTIRALGKEAVSVISMRPASRHERKLYADY
jgi:uncharacterized DUF497 family protein